MITVGTLYLVSPPNSPPIAFDRLSNRMIMARTAVEQNMVTENAKLPGSTSKVVPLAAWYMAARDHAIPSPKNTLTALLPVTLPIEESAYLSFMAATLLANVSVKWKTNHE